MRSIIDFAKENKIFSSKNSIVNRSLETTYKEDRLVRILAKEISDLVLKLFSK